MLRKHTDKELLLCLRQGDIKAFDELYHRYSKHLMAFASSFLADKTVAEEAVQEVFIKIWEKRRELDKDKKFKTYVFQAVKYYMFNYIRDKKSSCQLEDAPMECFLKANNQQDEMIFQELEETIFSMINTLPKMQQQVFRLSKLEGMSSDEIALELKLSKRTIEHHIYLATKFLKEELMHKASLYIVLILTFFA